MPSSSAACAATCPSSTSEAAGLKGVALRGYAALVDVAKEAVDDGIARLLLCLETAARKGRLDDAAVAERQIQAQVHGSSRFMAEREIVCKSKVASTSGSYINAAKVQARAKTAETTFCTLDSR